MPQMIEYKCPCCSGAIAFDSSLQKMKCPYCDTEFELDALKALDEEMKKAKPDDIKWEVQSKEMEEAEAESMSVYTCKSCGGEIVADENTAASSCPFCGNPVVMSGRLSGSLRPDYIIPFKLDKKTAKEKLKAHFSGKRLLPKTFKSENHIDEIKGIYVPFWVYDSNVNADIRYKATKLRYWSDGKYDYTETSHYSVFRSGEMSFSKIPVDASSKIANDLTESLEPYYTEEAVEFQSAYLAGYYADKYDVSAEESVERANERMKKSAEETLASTVTGYSSVMPETVNVQVKQGVTSYVLYPVWLLSTSWKGENYLFAMNGQTGKFVGNLPVDKGLFGKHVLKWTPVFSVIVYGILWLMHTIF